jgi:hypothetical protein
MHISATKVLATPASREYTTVVRLNVSGEEATIDMGDNPAYYPPAQVTELAISYRTSETFHGDTPTVASEVTAITYRIANRDYDTASLHPNFLAQPDKWPAWVRDLVSKYDPAT